jgi:hypothetical protein
VSLDPGPPERIPGGGAELAAHPLGGPGEDPSAVLPIEKDGFLAIGGGLLLQERLEYAVSRAAWVPLLGGQEVDDQVAGDPGEPAPERPPRRVGVPAVDRRRDGLEDVLGQVRGVRLLEPATDRQAADEGSVDLRNSAQARASWGSRRRTSRLGRVLGASVMPCPPESYSVRGRKSFSEIPDSGAGDGFSGAGTPSATARRG